MDPTQNPERSWEVAAALRRQLDQLDNLLLIDEHQQFQIGAAAKLMQKINEHRDILTTKNKIEFLWPSLSLKAKQKVPPGPRQQIGFPPTIPNWYSRVDSQPLQLKLYVRQQKCPLLQHLQILRIHLKKYRLDRSTNFLFRKREQPILVIFWENLQQPNLQKMHLDSQTSWELEQGYGHLGQQQPFFHQIQIKQLKKTHRSILYQKSLIIQRPQIRYPNLHDHDHNKRQT